MVYIALTLHRAGDVCLSDNADSGGRIYPILLSVFLPITIPIAANNIIPTSNYSQYVAFSKAIDGGF